MSEIEVYALKPFIYSTDGYTEIPVKEHETFMLPEKFFQGLNDARYVRRATIGDGKVSLKPEPKISDERLEELAQMTPYAQAKRFEKAYKETADDQKASIIVNMGNIPDTAYLPTAEPREKQEAVEIPDDWKSLKWFALRSLASKISDEPIKTMEQAVAAIEAELARRG